jgi:hypothetical protein
MATISPVLSNQIETLIFAMAQSPPPSGGQKLSKSSSMLMVQGLKGATF